MLGNSSPVFERSILNVIEGLKPKSILELGCGQGKFGRLLQQTGVKAELTAVQRLFADGDQAALRDVGYQKIVDQDILTYYEEGFDQTYDLVTVMDVIEHFLLPDVSSIIDFSLYRAKWLLLVWPSKHPQDGVTNKFDRHRSSFEIDYLTRQFDVVHYEQRGFAQMHFLHRYHLCVLRGHMNVENFPGASPPRA